MRKILKKTNLLGVMLLAFISCSDFEEININPTAASEDQVQTEYFINSSIGGAQQNPHISERIFVLYWDDAGRMTRVGTLSEGGSNDGWTSDYYNGYVSSWLRNINAGIEIADKQIASGNFREHTPNLKQVARIWRAYIMSEMTDNFGAIPINGFQGVNPEYSNVKEVYYYMLKELTEATSALDLSVSNPGNALKKLDPAYEYDFAKWQKYGNSLRMRLAMRLSQVDPAKAQSEFESAVGNAYIKDAADNFKVKETAGWSDYTAYDLFKIPGDFNDPEFNSYPSWNSNATITKRNLVDASDNVIKEIEAAFTWNAYAAGNWGDKGSKNKVYGHTGTLPRLANKYRNNSNSRIFFASWESHFLIAEAAVRGWDVPMSGQMAYEQGINQSFAYNGVSSHLGAYLTSQAYSRVGTSVSWTHTTEPASTVAVTYLDGYTNVAGVMNLKYPKNTIYKNGTVKNDLLTKIITQKFIAQTPWLPLETWSDHRRLGLPFFENPAVETPLTNMPQLTNANFMTNNVNFYGQRLKYPSNFSSNIPGGYQQAVDKLGGEDTVFTPLWWAQQN